MIPKDAQPLNIALRTLAPSELDAAQSQANTGLSDGGATTSPMQCVLEGIIDDATVVAATKFDMVAEALIQRGLVPNAFILDLNGALTVPRDMQMPYPWNLPSRLFMFPLEVTDRARDGSRRIGLLHPLLANHPFVKHVETTLGIQLDLGGAPNKYGYSKAELGSWWHAMDLIITGHWRDLLKTAQFTTAEDIARAVAHGMTYSPHQAKKRNGHISTTEAREIMAALDLPRLPTDREGTIREYFMPPSPVKSEKRVESWPVNQMARDQHANAWGHIFGIEAGWFAYDRAGYLGWTKLGRDRFSSKPVSAYPSAEPPAILKSDMARDDFAQTLGPNAADKDATQLDLF